MFQSVFSLDLHSWWETQSSSSAWTCLQQVLNSLPVNLRLFFSAFLWTRRSIWMPSSRFLDHWKTSSCVCSIYWAEFNIFFAWYHPCVTFTVWCSSSGSTVHWKVTHRRHNDSSSSANIWWVFPAFWFLRLLKVFWLSADSFVFALQPSWGVTAENSPPSRAGAAPLKVLPLPGQRTTTQTAAETTQAVQVSPGADWSCTCGIWNKFCWTVCF